MEAEGPTTVKKMKSISPTQDQYTLDGSSSFQPVLADEYMAPIKLVEMYVSHVKNKKDTSRILKFLSSVDRLDKYAHLKRVRSNSSGELQVIICDTSRSLDNILLKIKPYSSALGKVFPVKVPATQPLTRKQFEDSLQFWPVNFHEDKLITKMLNGTYFDSTSMELLKDHMTEAIRLAERAKANNQVPIGAVIVDPTSNKIVAKSHDLRHGNHKLHHATMVCIDMVAKSQGGGIGKWNYDLGPEIDQGITISSTEPQKALPYLCTGYHLYITMEPCVMCAMALVHSRIECVFYGSSQSSGALGSRCKLHVHKLLNHHYRVFKGLLKDKCDQLLANT